MSDFEIVFFSLGQTEAVRNAFLLGDVRVQEMRIKEKEFRKEYPSAAQGIVLKTRGKMVTGSQAILRYIGALGGLYSANAYEAMVTDEIMELCKIHKSKLLKSTDKRILEACLDDFDAIIGDEYAVGKSITIADLELSQFLAWILIQTDGSNLEILLTQYPKIISCVNKVKQNPAVRAVAASKDQEKKDKKLRRSGSDKTGSTGSTSQDGSPKNFSRNVSKRSVR